MIGWTFAEIKLGGGKVDISDQTILATTLAVLMGLLIWGKWRYDGVTLVCLAALVLFGVVPAESAFTGFGHPAVITVALLSLIHI